uniref:S1-like domain-containing protein n=1 Tax=viral metagenome TaxID=1070528 RepID=A0A6C0F2M7_9ZZZZ
MHPHGKKTFTNKSDPIVRNYIEDLRKDDTDHVHLARCLKRLGDGRVEVVYCIGEKGVIAQVIIPGRFRGRAKHSSFVDVGSYLLIGETGVSGPASLEMIALISDLQLETINKISPIDKRVLSKENDKEAIEAGKTNEDGFEFDRSAPVVEEKNQPVNIDDI